MIDISILRDHPRTLQAALERRGLRPDLDSLIALDEDRRATRVAAEALRHEQKTLGRRIALLQGDDKQTAIARARRLATRYGALLTKADELDHRFQQEWVRIPNPPHPTAADGLAEEDSVEFKRWGDLPQHDFSSKDHREIGDALGMIDIERAAKVSGSRFGYLTGRAVTIEFGLVRMALDALEPHGFVPVIPPVLVREQALFGTGFFPDDDQQVYELPRDDLYLIGTSEVALAAYHAEEILDERELPLRYAGFSSCFRREAGAAGKDTSGLFRVHQFDKVEMFSFCHPDRSWEEHELLLSLEEELVRALEIPYRVVNVAAGDLGASAAKKYDIEAWIPSQGRFREITSCSNTTDYQARRLRIRFRSKSGNQLVHTLNGTAIAVGRILIALLENHQQADGSVVVPAALRPYVGFDQVG